MAAPLQAPRRRASRAERVRSRRSRRPLPVITELPSTATIFMLLRRMRTPLTVLILTFAVSVLGLTLVPGRDDTGQPYRMGFFEAFYFMSYTATTIGFGEIPYAFTSAQRLWVTVSIYLSVIAWAYAIGALLTLLQDRAFRQALALQKFERKVARLRQPFLLLAGYGKTGELLGRSFDGLGHRFVVVDRSADRIDALEQGSFHDDVPGLVGDARDPHSLGIAGLNSRYCEAVLALTDDDEVNLAVTMATALLRPDVTVVARTVSAEIGHRMTAFGTPTVINPFERYGDHLLLALRAPSSFQLLTWLESGLGHELPARGDPPAHGRWVVCGYGRFGREVTADLRSQGLEVTAIDPGTASVSDGDGGGDGDGDGDVPVVVGDGSAPGVLARADLAGAVGFVAATDNDTTNLSLVAAARRLSPELFITARQNSPGNAALFASMELDSLLVPTELVAHEAYAQLSTPLLWRFLQEMPGRGDAWAADLVARLVGQVGTRLPALWKVRLNDAEAPALADWLAGGCAPLGDLLRNPEDRDEPLAAVVLLVLRGSHAELSPGPDFPLAPGDQLLIAGRAAARRALERTLLVDATREYVLTGRHVPASWVWRRLSRRGRPPAA